MFGLSGCTTIKSWFPDKERDYQFRTEVPELIIPDDLKSQVVTKPKMPSVLPVDPNRAVIQTHPVNTAKPALAPKATNLDTTAAETNVPVQVEVSGAAISSLQIDQPKTSAWRLVAKALSRQHIEIVERNLDNAYFYVKYDPNAVKLEDNSFWDEITFLFGEDPSHEEEYRISLLDITTQSTEVTVQNTAGKTLSNSTATRLLKLITDGINSDTPTGAGVPEKAAP